MVKRINREKRNVRKKVKKRDNWRQLEKIGEKWTTIEAAF